MGGFGSIWHWVIVLLVIVLLFGAKRIPELAKGLGSGIKNFKKAIKEDDDEEMEEIENKKQEKITATKTEKVQSTKTSKED
ncbi:twin-arginine translocase TatA/TatE family subunit [Helicobacter anatolicus]|uniref:twin-arginine translocase TatA/TatE family subunit n=1 Tax=Helicobacter anatolicus TaxID=2905874 RepID=UPI001E31D878|nr:twin-arginine translocase TatA/TatE family subunit [Helicobacter anatolicus]MCE3039490.1 twin-arginine translocase TatA/TatE family subunit [Helicobacter anatolicus]